MNKVKNNFKKISILVVGISLIFAPVINAMDNDNGNNGGDERELVRAAQESLAQASAQLQNLIDNYQQINLDPRNLNTEITTNLNHLRRCYRTLDQIQEHARQTVDSQNLSEEDGEINRRITIIITGIRNNITNLTNSLESMRRDHGARVDFRQGGFRGRLSGLFRTFLRSWRPGFVTDYRSTLQQALVRERQISEQMQTLFDILANRPCALPRRVDQQPVHTVNIVTCCAYDQQPRTIEEERIRAALHSSIPIPFARTPERVALENILRRLPALVRRDLLNTIISLSQENQTNIDAILTRIQTIPDLPAEVLDNICTILTAPIVNQENFNRRNGQDVNVQLHELANALRTQQGGQQRILDVLIANLRENNLPLMRVLAYSPLRHDRTLWLCEKLPLFPLRCLERVVRTTLSNDRVEEQTAQQPLWKRLFEGIKYNVKRAARAVICKTGMDGIAYGIDGVPYSQVIDRMQQFLRTHPQMMAYLMARAAHHDNDIRNYARTFLTSRQIQSNALRRYIQQLAQGWQRHG